MESVNLSPTDYMIVYGVVIGLLLIYFLRGFKQKQPMKLRMSADKQLPEADAVTGSDFDVKDLSVHFNYNGHSWEAYEALGLPAGSNWESVERAFKKAKATMDAESKPFIEAAYQAIKKHSN